MLKLARLISLIISLSPVSGPSVQQFQHETTHNNFWIIKYLPEVSGQTRSRLQEIESRTIFKALHP